MSQNSSGSSSGRFFGKYRGKVSDNKDPLMQGRIRAKVPAVFGDNETGWALPSAPYGGSGVGIFFIPPVDANVWIEFEEGNSEVPIWSGCFWGIGEAPKIPAIPDIKVIKTDFATITLNDLPGAGGVTIETTNGLKIVMNITGIELNNAAAKIKLTPASVSVNDGALDII
jgi:Type VI secretion system/phage-baseplate injector OB domain